ncbi:uncharacterized protein PpBr36_05643 [Pyricularia pennisetigena]|uniref:uncharacterized protein n=1 Tax=Pyricularia pennisetigena TaxID=1578925 RepID=UPI001154F6C1|nr:uncharacterized protein PpBr36_05643 [Pyricularia pennisetigena]TLS23226.1 hypothetical protein PpBr36_05643 [Pyricularia pennisetigena]
MKKKATDQLVYEEVFPRPKPTDPYDFPSFLERNLVLEVRQEVHSFFGHISDLESKYPGLDYTHPTHRMRLSRWQWHRRLFRAFDALGLTDAEIHGLTKWEGTKWAKERYEKDQGIIIRDTTADFIGEWVPPEERPASPSPSSSHGDQEARAEDSDDEVQASVGVELNERLVQRAAAHLAGDMSEPLDEEWEQWLKAALEAGEFPLIEAELQNRQAGNRPFDINLAHVVPQHIMAAATSGRWSDVPSALQSILRPELQRNSRNRPEARVPMSQNFARRTPGERNWLSASRSVTTRRPVPEAETDHPSLADPVQPLPSSREREFTPAYGNRPAEHTRRRAADRLEAEAVAAAALLERPHEGTPGRRAEAEFFLTRIAERNRLRSSLTERRPTPETRRVTSSATPQPTATARVPTQPSQISYQDSRGSATPSASASATATRTSSPARRPLGSLSSDLEALSRAREAVLSRAAESSSEQQASPNTSLAEQERRRLRLPTAEELMALEEAAAADRRSLLNIQRDLTNLTQRYHELSASNTTEPGATRRRITVRIPSIGPAPPTAEHTP